MKIFISWTVFMFAFLVVLLAPCWVALATGNGNNLWFLFGLLLSVPAFGAFVAWADKHLHLQFFTL